MRPTGLGTAAPTGATPATRTLLAGGADTAFDLPVGSVPSALAGAPLLVLYEDLTSGQGQGNAKGTIDVTLSDCTSAVGPCATVSSGSLGMSGRSTGYVQDTVTLSGATALLAPGHLLRLSLALTTQGNATSVLLGFDATATPSRLDLTAAPPP